MNLTYGTFRIIYEDALFTFGKILFLYITLPLLLLWITMGYFLEMGDDVVAAISGPAYFMVPIFAVAGFRSNLPVVIGFGGTRVNLLKTFYAVSLLSILVITFVLNIFQWMLLSVYERWNVAASILHPGIFFGNEYSFISYFLIDLMFVTFLFSFTFLFFTIYYRLGFMKSVITLMLLVIVGTLLNYSGIVRFSLLEWVIVQDFHGMVLFTFIMIVSLIALFITYPIMRNAPLQVKSRKE